MDWNDSRLCDQLAYDLVLGDYPRGQNRALIASIANGAPPYSDEEVAANNITVNVNDLSMTRLLHDARAQFYNGFLKPGRFFTLRTDEGPEHKRAEWGAIVTAEMNKLMKKSISYYEALRGKFGLLTLHGISPAVWENQDKWCPRPLGVEDVLIPSNTLLGFENLPFFILRRSFTGIELQKLTTKAKRDKGWNMALVNQCLEWIDSQTMQLMGSNWPEVWAPEKITERIKQDTGFYASDQVPTIDTFDIYGYVDDGEKTGWVRRIILDSWSTPATQGTGYTMNRDAKYRDLGQVSDFLFTSGDTNVADSWQQIISFQYADLSSVAPFRYHSVRSLGFLLYAACHLQNRLMCKFNEAVFEALMMYFRVKSMDDVQRALKLELANKGFIDDTITPVPAKERWQVDKQLVELGLQQNARVIGDNSSSMTQPNNFSRDNVEKTRYQVMAEVNAGTSLISSALNQAYMYQNFEYREIVRRFFKKSTTDKDCNLFQAACLRRGVPKKMMLAQVWEVESERVMGAGNKTLEMTISQQLMEWRPLFNPEAQQTVLRDSVLAITDDAAKANALVPEQPHVSDSIHDSELAFGALMQGTQVTPKPGLNAVDVASTIIRLLAQKVHEFLQGGGMAPPEALRGMQMAGQYAGAFIQQVAQDETSKELAKKLGDALGKLMNELKAFAQRMAQAQQKAAQEAQKNGNGQMDPKDAAKIQATMITAQAKMKNTRESHAQRTAQRQIQFQQQIQQDSQKHALDMQKEMQQAQLDIAAEKAKLRMKSVEE